MSASKKVVSRVLEIGSHLEQTSTTYLRGHGSIVRVPCLHVYRNAQQSDSVAVQVVHVIVQPVFQCLHGSY